MDDVERFYAGHCDAGGIVIVFARRGHDERVGVFSSLEKATIWIGRFGAQWDCVVSPYVVDDPDYGEEFT